MEEEKVKTTKRDEILFSYINEEEFESVYEEIFVKKSWEFQSSHPEPKILDVGAHIGVSILYFKKVYPDADIVGFEPNPNTFRLLKKNIVQNNLESVITHNVAVSDKEDKIDFYIGKNIDDQNWSWGDSAVKNKWYSKKTSNTIQVEAVKLSSYINEKIDLLKIDIEGMEERVLRECEQKLSNVKQIALEFHGSSTNPDNNIDNILYLLKKRGFSTRINQDWKLIDEKDLKKPDPFWASIYAKRT